MDSLRRVLNGNEENDEEANILGGNVSVNHLMCALLSQFQYECFHGPQFILFPKYIRKLHESVYVLNCINCYCTKTAFLSVRAPKMVDICMCS